MRVFDFTSAWWLRSPNSNHSNYARYVNNDGNVNNGNVNNANNGVRPDLLVEGLEPGSLEFRSKCFETKEQSKGTSLLAVITANLTIFRAHAFRLYASPSGEDGPFLL